MQVCLCARLRSKIIYNHRQPLTTHQRQQQLYNHHHHKTIIHNTHTGRSTCVQHVEYVSFPCEADLAGDCRRVLGSTYMCTAPHMGCSSSKTVVKRAFGGQRVPGVPQRPRPPFWVPAEHESTTDSNIHTGSTYLDATTTTSHSNTGPIWLPGEPPGLPGDDDDDAGSPSPPPSPQQKESAQQRGLTRGELGSVVRNETGPSSEIKTPG